MFYEWGDEIFFNFRAKNFVDLKAIISEFCKMSILW